MKRRLVVTVCLRERGTVVLPVEAGGRPVRMDAPALLRRLAALVTRRGLGARVLIRQGCAGGCARPGPNVDVAVHAAPRSDSVALRRRTYVYTLPALDCLARVVDDNLHR